MGKLKFDDLKELLLDVRKKFPDKIDRQHFFYDLKAKLGELWRNRDTNSQYKAQVIDLLFRAIRFTRPEDLKEVSQINSLLRVVEKLKKPDMTRDEVRECGRILWNSGFETLPKTSLTSGKMKTDY